MEKIIDVMLLSIFSFAFIINAQEVPTIYARGGETIANGFITSIYWSLIFFFLIKCQKQ